MRVFTFTVVPSLSVQSFTEIEALHLSGRLSMICQEGLRTGQDHMALVMNAENLEQIKTRRTCIYIISSMCSSASLSSIIG